MHTETIPIVTTKERFFLEYLTLKKPIIDAVLFKINGKKTRLSDVPLGVLAQLLFYNDMYKDQPEETRWDIVFSREVRLSIQDALGIKEHLLNNYISYLRKIKILDGKRISKHFVVYADQDRELSFKFMLNGHKQ